MLPKYQANGPNKAISIESIKATEKSTAIRKKRKTQ